MDKEIEVISRLLNSTNTQKRPFNLLEIAEDLEWLSNHLGGLNKVSDILGISEGMLSQFLRVKKIDSSLHTFIKKREIDSVAIIQNLAKFSVEDQKIIASFLLNKTLSGKNIRLLNPLRKEFPNDSIKLLIDKLNDSENKKISVIVFDIEDLHKDITNLQKDISNMIGTEELVDINIKGKDGYIKVTSKGEQRLRKIAKTNRKTLQDLTYSILQ